MCVNNVWEFVKECMKVCGNLTNEFLSSFTCFRHQTLWNQTEIGQSSLKSVKSMLRVYEKVWMSVWKCVEISPMSSQSHVHTFRHPACWNETEIGQNCLKCGKSVWRVCESVCRSAWKFVEISPAHVHALRHQTHWNWTKIGQDGQSVWKVCEECVRVCAGVCETITNEFPSSCTCFQTSNMLKLDRNWPKYPKVCEKCVKSVWKCVKGSVKACGNVINRFPSLCTCF